MASKRKSSGPGGIPWAIVVPVVHAAVDLATSASCPDCGHQVVLYICIDCKKVVWPNRGQAAA
jgi:DNA-directed RNA polymerase subunit RPC12/RpoP